MSDEDILKAETLMSTNGVKFIPIGEIKGIKFESNEETPAWAKVDITQPVEFSTTIHAKKKGTAIEKSLYYGKSKKKRIRKKWALQKVLGIKE